MMVYKCCVKGCQSNYTGTTANVPVFKFPKNTELAKRWEIFASGTNTWQKKKTSRICINHFAPSYIKEGVKSRPRLITKLKPVPTIIVGEESAVVSNMKHPVSVPRKSPTKRVYQPDQYEDFLAGDRIESLNDIDDKVTPMGFNVEKFEEHIVFFKIQSNDQSILEVTSCIRIDSDLQKFIKRRYRFRQFSEGR